MSITSDVEQAKFVLEQAEHFELLPKHSNMRVLARVWIYPTFAPWMSWTVLSARSGFYVRRIIWDQSRQNTATFSFFGSEGHLQKEVWTSLASELDQLVIQPFVAVNGLHIDGTIFGVERISDCITAKLSWWGDPPSSWEAVAHWHTTTIKAFQLLLPAHHNQRT